MDDDEPIVTVPGTGKTMAMAWALALVLQRDENGGPPEPPCPHEPRRRGIACP
jgi:hypothetical protein